MGADPFGIVGTTQAGSFRVGRVVAEGGFGVIYHAEHAGFRAPVALKCLKIPGTLDSAQRQEFLERFRQEAELLFRLSASIEEVVRPLHVDAIELADGRFVPFIALEWLEGDALDEILWRRRTDGQPPMTLAEAMALLGPIARALARAHRFPGPAGAVAIVHRDVKPANVFVCGAGDEQRVKILDFGMARAKTAASRIAGNLTAEDGLAGFTPAYAAPEQWVPKRFGQTGPWTDAWGVALTMVEMLAGRPPIDGEIPAMMGTAIDEARRPTPLAEGVAISADVDAVFARALAVDPRDRTRDVATFWAELEAATGCDGRALTSLRPIATVAPRARGGPRAAASSVPRRMLPREGALAREAALAAALREEVDHDVVPVRRPDSDPPASGARASSPERRPSGEYSAHRPGSGEFRRSPAVALRPPRPSPSDAPPLELALPPLRGIRLDLPSESLPAAATSSIPPPGSARRSSSGVQRSPGAHPTPIPVLAGMSRPPLRASGAAPAGDVEDTRMPAASSGRRLRAPILLLCLGLAMVVAHTVHGRAEALSVGPLKIGFAGVALVAFAVGLFFWRLLDDS